MGVSGIEGRLRGMETRIAEDMTSILDFLSRIQQGLDEGSWFYARDKIPELVRAAERLDQALTYELEEKRRAHRARPTFVTAAISQFARHYRAGRALYPIGGDATRTAVRTAVERLAIGVQIDPPEGCSPADADRLAGLLRQLAAPKPAGPSGGA